MYAVVDVLGRIVEVGEAQSIPNGSISLSEYDYRRVMTGSDSTWTFTNGVLTETASPGPDSGQLIAAAHARINAAYEDAVGTITAGYPQSEIASWPKQESEARSWLANNTIPSPWLDSATAARAIPKSDFVALVIANADALAPIHGALTGKRQSLRDEIDAAGPSATTEQLDLIQW